jgi:hypothetical protein
MNIVVRNRLTSQTFRLEAGRLQGWLSRQRQDKTNRAAGRSGSPMLKGHEDGYVSDYL